MDYRVLTEAERKYTFSQSQQLSMQTGLIGYLRADFGSNGNEFWTTWNDFRKDLKTDEFKSEFDDVINGLRDGDVLSGRKSMSSYCYSTPDSSFNDDRNHYGIRLDTEKYSYLMRFNPNRGEYNLYCYCYQKEWLNSHLKIPSVVSDLLTRTIRSSFALRTERKSQLSSATAKQWRGLADILTTTIGGRHKSLPYLRICQALREKRSYRRTSRKRKHKNCKGQRNITIRRCRRGGKKI